MARGQHRAGRNKGAVGQLDPSSRRGRSEELDPESPPPYPLGLESPRPYPHDLGGPPTVAEDRLEHPEGDPSAPRSGGRADASMGTMPGVRPPQSKELWRDISRRERIMVVGGAELRLVVLACTWEDTTAVDLASGALVRLRVPWPPGHEPDLGSFDVVEARLADDPERDDLAQPEALTAADLPRHIGTLRGRRLRRMLARLAAPPDGPLLGFPGPSAPYWDFRGARPSAALIVPTRGPQLIRRREEGSTWVRFGWDRDDVWLPVLDPRAARALDAARRERLSGKNLATALGYRPHYLLASLSRPRDGHCYKVVTAVLPRG